MIHNFTHLSFSTSSQKEYEIDKTHNINGPEDVQKIGIKKYNELCRSIVTRYSEDWEQIITRMGRWIGKVAVLILMLH